MSEQRRADVTSGSHTPARKSVPLQATLRGLFVTAVILALGFVGMAIWLDHVQTRQQAEQQLRMAAALMEEHAVGVIRAADQLAARAELLVQGRVLDDLWDDRARWAELKAMAESLPHVVSLVVINRDGRVVLGTRLFPSRRTDASHREYFRALVNGAETHIGRTIFGPVARRYIFTVSRRLSAPDGTFAGAVVATLDIRYFEEAYEKAGLGHSAVLFLARPDGTVVVHHPFSRTALEHDFSDSLLFRFHLPNRPRGHYVGRSPVDGVERMIAYQASDRLPLVAAAALAVDEVYHPWRRRTAWLLVLAVAALAATGLLFRLVLHGLDREMRVRADLERANAAHDATNKSLADALAQKEVLFREVHHRVSNNLQIVSSLLKVQSVRTEDCETREALKAMLNRIDAMALLHRVLYRTDRAARIDFPRYLQELCENLAGAFAVAERGIVLSVRTEPWSADLDRAVPVALAVNVAITNAIKHAFPDGRRGTITVRLRRQDHEAVVEVRDDSVGLDAAGADSPGIGRMLLTRLVQQAGGRYVLETAGGTTFRVTLPQCRASGSVTEAAGPNARPVSS